MKKINQGFSLVELIVVIAIMAILVGVAVPMYSHYVEKAQSVSDEDFLENIKKATQLFAAENGIEIGSVSVDSSVTGSQGLTLYLSDGTVYSGDLSELYAMIGAYDFKTNESDITIKINPETSVPEQTTDDKSCEHDYGDTPTSITHNVEVYTCIHCGLEDIRKFGDDLGGIE